MRIRVDSLGCRLNIGEMDALARRLAGDGHRVVGPGERADLIVLNSCAVTHVASRKSRKVLRQLRRDNPDARLVATGCHADLEPEETAGLGVDLVVTNEAKDELRDILETRGWLRESEPVPATDAAPIDELPGLRTRAFVKVQDGCDNRCTFCIVTVARGAGRSRERREVVAEVTELADLGYREVVLTGVHLGSYGHDRDDRQGLRRLVTDLLERTEIPRIRLSSLEPWDLDADFFELWSDRRLQPHLHLPLQSGCDVTLERMARRTSQREFSALLESARERIPDLAVSTDVIVGFPGEDDAEFEASLAYVENCAFSRLHVFRYSPREGTAAAGMIGQVSPERIRERSRRMHRLGARLEEETRQRFVGRTMEVLWETSEPRQEGSRWSGLTGNYLRVVVDTDPAVDLENRITPARVVGAIPGALVASSRLEPGPEAVPAAAVATGRRPGPDRNERDMDRSE